MFHLSYRMKQCIPFLLLAGSNTYCLSFTEASDNKNEETFNGVPIKKWAQELKQKHSSNSVFDVDLDKETNGDRGDIRVFKEFHANGGKKPRNRNKKPSSSQKSGVYDVIIVGAGWSGIAAAMTLESKGITNYVILEARDYIGGRSHTTYETVDDKTVPVDLGSMWLHGGVNHPLHEVAKTTGTIPMSDATYSSYLYKDSNAGPFSDQDLTSYYDDLWYGFYDVQRERQSSTEKDEALQVSADLFTNTLGSDFEKNIAKTFMTWNIRFDYSAPLSDLSTWWWNNDEGLDAQDIYLSGGYSPLVDAYSAPITDKVEKESVVTRINYKRKTINVSYSKSGSEENIILKTKKVIVTVPLGVLKNNSIKFVPKLPGTRRRAIRRLGMGHMNKIFMIWKSTDNIFWPSGIEMFSDTVQRNTEFLFFSHGAFDGGESHMIFAFFAGSDIDGTMDYQEGFEAKVAEIAMESLRNMFGSSINDPEKVTVTKWKTDEYAFGSYSFNKLGAGKNFRKHLKKPIKQRVYIAGEATSTKYHATTHGAYFSGVAAGTSVANSLGRDK
jgi:monoamine oxidase